MAPLFRTTLVCYRSLGPDPVGVHKCIFPGEIIVKKFIVLSAIVASYFVLLVGSGGESAEDRAKKVATLKTATAEKLNMKDLAAMFNMGSKATDLQRDAKEGQKRGVAQQVCLIVAVSGH